MKKRFFAFAIALCLLFLIGAPAFAAPNRVLDGAELMSGEEVSALRAKADALSEASGLDVVILTVDTTGGIDTQSFADDYYDESGFRDDGVLFLWPVEERELTISTKGRGIEIFTDYGIDRIFDEVTPSFVAGEYAEGFELYLDMAAEYIDREASGDPVDTWIEEDPGDGEEGSVDEPPVTERKRPGFSFFRLIVSLLIGFLLGGIPLAKHKKAVQNVAMKTNASDYTRPESFDLARSTDVFLYQNVTRTPRSTESNSSGGHSGGAGRSSPGGSSTHVSSSGATHGGGSRKI